MKKLMIAAAIVCAAAMSQAATIVWSGFTYEGGEIYDYSYLQDKDGNNVTKMADGYSIVLAAITGDFSGDSWTATYLDTAMIGDDSSIGGSYAFSYDSRLINNGDVVAAVLMDDKGNFSKLQYVAGGDITETMTISGLDNGLYSAEFDFAHNGNVLNTAAAVPEPTSGLLLLLGVAGMALRRRRA